MKTNTTTHISQDEYDTFEEAISSVECNGYFVVINDDDMADVYFYDDEEPVRMIYKDEDSGRYIVGL